MFLLCFFFFASHCHVELGLEETENLMRKQHLVGQLSLYCFFLGSSQKSQYATRREISPSVICLENKTVSTGSSNLNYDNCTFFSLSLAGPWKTSK